MIVGTSLGHTGGTLDKLCSIPGYQPYLSIEKFKKNVNKVGISIMGQTQDICPGDKKIYELRDRMNMIDSYPLICGSIMSKKIAEGIDTLVLDIKIGNGAFMHTLDMAKNLGKLLKEIGELNNIKVKIAITDMNQPLGNYSGVACEIIESMEALQGNGPEDLMDVVYYLAEQIILMNGNKTNHQKLEDLINSGEAYQKFIDMVEAHGGSIEKFNQIYSQNQNFKYTLLADRDGYVKSFQTQKIGEILSSIGAGRLNNTDGIDNHSSLKTFKKISNKVSKGEPILKYCCASEEKINNLRVLSDELFKISESECPRQELIYQ
jgi:pyrimidine-nucleoside phosphorylase